MNLRCIRLSVVVALVASACSGGGGTGTRDTGATSIGGTAGSDSSSARSPAPSFDLAALTAALKGFTSGSLGDHDVVGDDLIAAMGISEALGGEADQNLGLAAGARVAALAQLSATSARRRVSPTDRCERCHVAARQERSPTVARPGTAGSADETATNSEESTSPTPGAGAGATSTISQSITDSVVASQVQMSIHRRWSSRMRRARSCSRRRTIGRSRA